MSARNTRYNPFGDNNAKTITTDSIWTAPYTLCNEANAQSVATCTQLQAIADTKKEQDSRACLEGIQGILATLNASVQNAYTS